MLKRDRKIWLNDWNIYTYMIIEPLRGILFRKLLRLCLCVSETYLVNLQVSRNTNFLWFNGQLFCVKVTQCNDWNLWWFQVLEGREIICHRHNLKLLLTCIDWPFKSRSYTGNKLCHQCYVPAHVLIQKEAGHQYLGPIQIDRISQISQAKTITVHIEVNEFS